MTYGWGVWGTGEIAKSMAQDLALVTQARRAAVGSRTRETAEGFARQWGFDAAHEGLESLVRDPKVDILYVASPNSTHYEAIVAGLEADKAVLCEKPLTLTLQHMDHCMALAKERGLFLMEGMWMAHFPAVQRALSLIQNGDLGRVHLVRTDFVSYRDPGTSPHLFDPELGGGALNDLGVYVLALATLMGGALPEFDARVQRAETGVDCLTTLLGRNPAGVQFQLSCGFNLSMPILASVYGDKGALHLGPEFNHPNQLNLQLNGKAAQIEEFANLGLGLTFEVQEVHRCLAASQIESPAWTWDQMRRVCGSIAALKSSISGRKF